MSFKETLLRASTLPTPASTRAILWLAGIGKPSLINKKGADHLQQQLDTADRAIVGFNVTPSSVQPGYYVDSVHLISDREAALKVLVEATDSALLHTLEPAEITEARAGMFVEDASAWNAWDRLGHIDAANVTARALEIAALHREHTIENSLEHILFQ